MFDRPRVDPEFLGYIPQEWTSEKDDDELFLKLHIEGCREPIVAWASENILVDGHRRERLCNDTKRLEAVGRTAPIPHQVEYVEFSSRESVLAWMRHHQLYGKRNLTDEQRSYLIGKEMIAAKDGEKAAVATKNKVSRRKTQLDEKFAKAVDAHEAAAPGTKAKILSGAATKTRVIETAPKFCPRCTRIGRPVVNCQNCAAVQKKKPKHQPKDLFDTAKVRKAAQAKASVERSDRDEITALTTKLAGLFTAYLKKTGPNGEVDEVADRTREYLTWAGLLEYPKGKPPRFIPLDGVACLFRLAGLKTKMKQPEVLEAYKKACGACVYIPPATKFRRERRGD
jgi:hypothetical protein